MGVKRISACGSLVMVSTVMDAVKHTPFHILDNIININQVYKTMFKIIINFFNLLA